MRLAAYAGASTVAAAGVVLWAFHQRANFYSACVYLAQSNLCLMILTNLILLVTVSCFYLLQRLCYGPLRPIEVEQLYEKAWFAITETCLAMTIFREEVGAWFLVMFVALLAGKVWGWIGEGRVEVLEQQPPANPRLFHARLSSSLALSLIYDISIMSYTVNTVIQQARPNMMVMFLFEFAILTTSSFSTALRYCISLIEANITKQQTQERLAARRTEVREAREEAIRQRDANASADGEGNTPAPVDLPAEEDIEEMDIEVSGWEAKGQWILTLDLLTDLFKLVIYGIFFFILLSFYGLPIHIMRDLFLTARSFVKRLTAFLRYRRATQDMNRRYPDATAEDLAREDTCIICREDMRPWSDTNPANPPGDGAAPPVPPRGGAPVNERSRPKKLPCGHILHLGCLRSWLERQQMCPTCRRPVVDSPRATAERPNNQANGQGAAAPNQPHQPGGAPPPAAPRVGMRMINFGPLRVGFGQGNFQDIAQQLGAQQPNPGARMYGFELGFPRNQQQPPQPAAGVQAAPAAQVQAQLQVIEQQLMQQIRSLQVTQQELQIVQLLQGELTRLRNLQNNVQNPPPVTAGTHVPLANHAPLGGMPMPNQPLVQRHAALPGTSTIPSGSPNLPPGVNIPEGWSLLPLQRLDGPAANSSGVTNASRPGGNAASSPPSAAGREATGSSASNNPASTLSHDAGVVNAPPQETSSATIPANTASQEPSAPQSTQSVGHSEDSEAQTSGNSSVSARLTPSSTGAVAGDLAVVPTVAPVSSSSTPTPPAAPEASSSSTTEIGNETPNENNNSNENEEEAEVPGTEADEERRQAKGKARAVTVEDSVDED